MQIKTDYLKKWGSWLLPYTCILCSNVSDRRQDLCEGCLRDLPTLIYCCPRCAGHTLLLNQSTLCMTCITQMPPFDRTCALYFYENTVMRLIMDLKFGEKLVNARVLGELLAHKIQTIWYRQQSLPEAIIPMPLHPARLKIRGYNQALEIAKPIAKALKIPLDTAQCQRIKNTAAQATLHAKQRERNIKNAFKIANTLQYQHVAVVDDVITTGYTITEFCRSLKSAGVKTIDVWCCARPTSGT